jgi:hypothetical protein
MKQIEKLILKETKGLPPYCRLLDYFTYLKFSYFAYQSGCVFRSERAPIGLGNGTDSQQPFSITKKSLKKRQSYYGDNALIYDWLKKKMVCGR